MKYNKVAVRVRPLVPPLFYAIKINFNDLKFSKYYLLIAATLILNL